MTDFKTELNRRAAALVGPTVPEGGRVRVEFETRTEGYCETCEYTTTVMEVTVYDADDRRVAECTQSYAYTDLIADLTREDE